MKLKLRHIQKFEAFIQNSKDPNEKDTDKTKDDKKSTPVDEDEQSQDAGEDENDSIEEMKRYFTEQEKRYPYLWKSAI
jgi:hypothetical protein